ADRKYCKYWRFAKNGRRQKGGACCVTNFVDRKYCKYWRFAKNGRRPKGGACCVSTLQTANIANIGGLQRMDVARRAVHAA
ncbi:MAG: hypothetical protein K2O00_08920, partial [Muribaculaceae bacterium]|nr:hypothetical protein [Muribaculaceae bacterium]